jgi:hypothetical protein
MIKPYKKGAKLPKGVVRFRRETTVKDDICYNEGNFNSKTLGVSCNNCRVHIVTDRFLSRKFQQVVMHDTRDFPMGVYPYVLIIDTALCNLRCRACYSSKYWNPDKDAQMELVTPEILARQFECKIAKLHDEELLEERRIGEKTKRPFSRLRISGGEPLFDGNNNSTEFWLKFFSELDKIFEGIIEDEQITLRSEQEWISMSKTERLEVFPVFLKSDNDKIRIRFDTNGWLFKNKDFVERFIGGFYSLNLQYIKLDLTFSVKGTNKYEVECFVNSNVAFDATKKSIDETLEEHPQWQAIHNIMEVIKSKESPGILTKPTEHIISETYFNPCGAVSLTVERGIMNSKQEHLYLYHRDSLKWESFADKLKQKGLLLSETENCIYFGQYPVATAWRYIHTGNYELTFKCPHHENKPFLSYSKNQKSTTQSIKHRQISSYNDDGLKHFAKRISIQNGMFGKQCKYSTKPCEYWIEMIPMVGN